MPQEKALNLVFFGHSAGLTGAERSLLSLVDDLIQYRGARCTVFLPHHGPLEHLLRNAGAEVVVIPLSWWAGLKGTEREVLASALSAEIGSFLSVVVPLVKNIDPDVVATQTMVIPWGAAAASALGKPHIWSVCEYGELDHGLDFVEPLEEIVADISGSSEFVFFACHDIKNTLFSNLAQDRCDVLYRHIQVPEFGDVAESEREHLPRVIGLFGTIAPSKGQADAIEAVSDLKTRGIAVELFLAGAGSAEYVCDLKSRAQSLGIGELVRFNDFLDDPYPAMHACDILLVCSRREAFGRTGAEAMLLGKPVIYAASGGVAEYIEDGTTGLSYPPGDFKGLASRIETLLRNPVLGTGLGQAARVFARAAFTRENYGGKFYAKALALRGRPSLHSNFPRVLLPIIQRTAEFQSGKLGELKADLAAVRYQIETLSAEKTSAQARFAIAITEKIFAESRLEIRTAELTEASRRIADLTATLDEQKIQLSKARDGIAAIEKSVTEAERHAAGLGAALDEQTTKLTDAKHRIAALDKLVVERDQELSIYASQIAAMKASLSWRLTVPLREMYNPFRHVGALPLRVKLSAALRHPVNSRKRKKYRRLHMRELGDFQKRLCGVVSSAPPDPIAGSNPRDFVPLSNKYTFADRCDVKLIAYYLPQFHPIPENDEWWGRGFTEWRNVARALPVFEEHYQPRIPGELGYYDLRLIDNMHRQVELAMQYGLSAFCFHFYWFGGKRLLELPIEAFLTNKELDLQFSLCWANENWSRRWDGGNNELLIAQDHSPEDDIDFIRYLNRYFQDSRYMKVDGKPVLTVYRPGILPNAKETLARWRREAHAMGYPGLYLIATNSFGFEEHINYGFDALSEFPPHSFKQIQQQTTRKSGSVFSYPSGVDVELRKQTPIGIVHPGVMPGWDNTARKQHDGHIYHGATPALFQRWLKHCFIRAHKHREGERFVFINAWNEWAEGAYLEPDQRYGYAYLAACAAAIADHAESVTIPSLPNVSAIVPNYNHGRFLRERINSILEQHLQVFELIILDDSSTDNSRDIIAGIAADVSVPVKIVFNDTNSGSVFSQWVKGICLAEGDLIWICESDDTCDRGFLQALVPYFEDQSVMLAFGRVDFIEEDGRLRPGMDEYMESAESGFWKVPRIESARAWFHGPFGVRNVIPNVGGCVFRRQQITPDLLAELTSYKVCGDWHLYSRLAHGGRIAFDPTARSYFRQHGANTSVSNFQTESFFAEHIRIASALSRHYGTGPETLRKMLRNVHKHYGSVFGEAAALNFAEDNRVEDILAQERRVTHTLIAMYGFHTGGGEIFPIHLANELMKRGYDVSLLIASESGNDKIRRMLAPAIPIFTKRFVEKIGLVRFLDDYGVDLIHTHNIDFDMWFGSQCASLRTPYVVTHHGSYEAVPPDRNLMVWLLNNVDHWVYIADKNIDFMNGVARDECTMTKLPNALPQVQGEFPFSRQDLGIEPNAFVFGLASRAIRSKGWDIAIHALRVLRGWAARPVYLLLCGDGEDLNALEAAYSNELGVRFLGYQDKIQAFYRICDCCLLPTRYVGESYPLTIIEAILAGIPTIATDVGEIKSILQIDLEPMGIVAQWDEDDAVFSRSIQEAMRRMLDDGVYENFRGSVLKNRHAFSMDELVDRYIAIYQRVLSRSLERKPLGHMPSDLEMVLSVSNGGPDRHPANNERVSTVDVP